MKLNFQPSSSFITPKPEYVHHCQDFKNICKVIGPHANMTLVPTCHRLSYYTVVVRSGQVICILYYLSYDVVWVLPYIPVHQEGQNQLIDSFAEIKNTLPNCSYTYIDNKTCKTNNLYNCYVRACIQPHLVILSFCKGRAWVLRGAPICGIDIRIAIIKNAI